MSEMCRIWRRIYTTTTKFFIKKHLTIDLFTDLQFKRTIFGGTINDCIRAGCQYPRNIIGIFACDPDAYVEFADIFVPIIKEYHRLDSETHPQPDYGDPSLFSNFKLHFFKEHVISSSIKVSRNFEGYRFPAFLTLNDRLEIEKLVVGILNNLKGDLTGHYFPYVGMTENERKILTDMNLYFNHSDKLKKVTGCLGDWPIGSGAFLNAKNNLGCCVNETDHLRVCCTEEGFHLTECFELITRFLVKLEKQVEPAMGIFGHLSYSLSNIGTAMTMCLLVKLPNSKLKKETLKACKKFDIECRRIYKLFTYWVWEIINKRYVGTTEFKTLQNVIEGAELVLITEYRSK